jgi:glycolate oxidase FAD binding subunit
VTIETLHPRTASDVVEIVRDAGEHGTRLLPVGGRRHIDRGNPSAFDAELWTTQLDAVIAYDPAEMLVVVEAGMRVGALQALLAEGGQEWAVDAPLEATVGGVIAAGVSSPRRRRVGTMRDSVVELTAVTGDGRRITSGARTVKNVSGYDLHRLMAGSLGTLGVIVQVALKVRPLPRAERILRTGEGGMDLASALVEGVPSPIVVIAEPAAITVSLEGWPDEVEDQLRSVRSIADAETLSEGPILLPNGEGPGTVLEISVRASALNRILAGASSWQALAGVGVAWILIGASDELSAIRAGVASLGGVAPAVRGPGGLGANPLAAVAVQRRIKDAFDPHGIFAPGRFWGGI